MPSLRYALRSLRRSPGFVMIAVLALGLGLGLSTTMFAVLDAVVNPYVPYREPDNLFVINAYFGPRNPPMTAVEIYQLLRDRTRSFEAVVGYTGRRALLEAGQDRQQISTYAVPPRYWDITGLSPRLGRTFMTSDGEQVAVLNDELWKRLFGSRRNLRDATITLDGVAFVVVGVLPRGIGGEVVWLPTRTSADSAGASLAGIIPVARLRYGVSREAAQRELRQLARELTDRFSSRHAPFGLELVPMVSRREEIKDIHKAMVGSALAVLIIACVNLAHLMMARGLAKRRELALRMAVGASRAAVVRQLFIECLLITLGGAALGAIMAVWGAGLLRHAMPRDVSWLGLLKPQLSWRVFAVGALAAACSAILFGLLPAIRVVTSLSLDEPLKDDTGTTSGRVRQRYNLLVVSEVALALVLMMGGGLLLRTVHGLQREDPGINERTLWRARLGTARTWRDSTARPIDRAAILAAARSTPGVRDAALAVDRPMKGYAVTAELSEDSNRVLNRRSLPVVSSSFFQVMGLPVLRGRDFEPGDEASLGVAIVDALAAGYLYPHGEALGRMLKLGSPTSDAGWVRIVGVVRSPRPLEGDARYAPQPNVWLAGRQASTSGEVLMRAASPDAQIGTAASTRLREIPGILYAAAWPADYTRRSNIASRGFLARVFVAMGVVALALSALGLYGVLAYAVGRRMREFAVRIALGAEPPRLLRMVLHDGFVMLLAGIGLGAFAALAASRLLDSVLISVLPSDVFSLVASEAVLILTGLAAALAPARRAANANPLVIRGRPEPGGRRAKTQQRRHYCPCTAAKLSNYCRGAVAVRSARRCGPGAGCRVRSP